MKLVVISQALKNLITTELQSENAQKYITVCHDAASNSVEKTSANKFKTSYLKQFETNIGYVGHLYQGRGIDKILQMAEALPTIGFHIVGGNAEDIEYWTERKKLKNVIFYGFQQPSSIAELQSGFDILLAPYQSKVSVKGKGNTSTYMSPLKIFEYMRARKPIICSDLPVIREVLNDSNSYLVSSDNAQKWVETINKIIGSRKDAYERASQAYQDYLNFYTWDKRAETIAKIILDK